MKKILILLLCCSMCGMLQAQETIPLNGTWLFSLAKNAQEAKALENFHDPDFKPSGFDKIPVPSNWAVLGYEEPVYSGFKENQASEGFYVRDFELPKSWNGKRVLLHFGGVWASAEVWLNGQYVGPHDGGYNSFAFNVSDKLNAKGKNRLCVRVKQASRSYKFDTYDDWTLGGIYRDVTLEAMPAERWLDQVVVRTEFDKYYKNSTLKVCVMVGDRHPKKLKPQNTPIPGTPYKLRFSLKDAKGKTVLCKDVDMPPHSSTSREYSGEFIVESPLHWTAETPNLYDFSVEIVEDNEVTHAKKMRIGFREVSTKGGVLRINGQTVKLRGVNRHDEHPDVGRATTREHWEKDIRMMKEANINYIRAAHYPHAKGFLDLCDELGMYVGDEISLGGAADLVYDPSYYDVALQRTFETVMRDLHSPSVIYWSVGNEDPLSAMMMNAIKVVKALDPTRPVLMPWQAESWIPREIDILAPHYWNAEKYDYRTGQADRPVISTEYTHAYGEDGFGGLKERWQAISQHPSGAGAAIWMWADQGIKTPASNPDIKSNDQNKGDLRLRIDNRGWDGIVDSYRNLTPDYWEAKAVYAPVFPLDTRLPFIPGQETVDIMLQNDYDFTNLSDIRIDWSLWEEGVCLDSATARIDAVPHSSAKLTLPSAKLGRMDGEKLYHYRLTFVRPDGSVLGSNSVELSPVVLAQPQKAGADINVTEGDQLVIEVGNSAYRFNPSTGSLVSASLNGKQIVKAITPVIWHKLGISEVSVVGKKKQLPTMDRFVPTVKSWKVVRNDDETSVYTDVEYRADEDNRFSVACHYSVDRQGVLTVNYQLRPQVKVPYLPLVGMDVETTGLEDLHWLGLGPHDAYPNKCSASLLNVWGGKAGSQETAGTKKVRRIDFAGAEGCLQIHTDGYMEHNVGTPDRVSVLTEVLGRPEKGRRNDKAVQRLAVSDGKMFVGRFQLTLQ